jgi:hypothetical protein
MVNYRPMEERQLEGLIPAMNQGMDPTVAMQIFQSVNGGATDRAAEQAAYRKQMMLEAMAQMQAGAAGGMGQAGLESLLGSFQSAVPGLNRPKIDERLEGSLDALIPQGMDQSPMYQPEMLPPGEQAPLTPDQVTTLSMEPESVQGIQEHATALATSGVSLHDARMQIIDAGLRRMGYPESALLEAYNLIGTIYEANAPAPGGTHERSQYLNAPLTRSPSLLQGAVGGTLDQLAQMFGGQR